MTPVVDFGPVGWVTRRVPAETITHHTTRGAPAPSVGVQADG